MEKLRKKLHEYIELYGFLDPRTIEVSQQLDKLVAEEQGRRLDEFKLSQSLSKAM